MENLGTVIKDKTLEQLQAAPKVAATTRLEPTVPEIETILGHLKDGKDYRWIKRNVRRVVTKDGKQISAQGFSVEQLKEIDAARQAKIAELSPKPDPSILPVGP